MYFKGFSRNGLKYPYQCSVISRPEYKHKYSARCTSKSFQGMHWSTHTSAVWSAHNYTNTNTVQDVLQRVLKECPPVQCDQHTNREGAEPRLTALSTRQNSTLTLWQPEHCEQASNDGWHFFFLCRTFALCLYTFARFGIIHAVFCLRI